MAMEIKKFSGKSLMWYDDYEWGKTGRIILRKKENVYELVADLVHLANQYEIKMISNDGFNFRGSCHRHPNHADLLVEGKLFKGPEKALFWGICVEDQEETCWLMELDQIERFDDEEIP